ncbi:unnamed protein product [Amoebophrya sp. A120]|nr:unnamed protein product [Amoebophrya sp. A120]|eukprot:GSA120T00001307001.1
MTHEEIYCSEVSDKTCRVGIDDVIDYDQHEFKYKRYPSSTCIPCRNYTDSILVWNGKTKLYTKWEQPISCQTKNIVYAMQCSHCHLIYIGQTTNMLRKRFSNHRQELNFAYEARLWQDFSGIRARHNTILYHHFARCPGKPQVMPGNVASSSELLTELEEKMMRYARSLFPYGLSDKYGKHAEDGYEEH